VWGALAASSDVGERPASLGGGTALVRVEPARHGGERPDATRPWFPRFGPDRILSGAAPSGDARAAAAAWARAVERPSSAGRTPFVVTISDLLDFARSPRDHYATRLVGEPAAFRGTLAAEREDPASEGSAEGDAESAREDRVAGWDEGREVLDGLDRAALGRAVHRAIELLTPDATTWDDAVERALEEEHGGAAPPAAREAARAMVRRFAGSTTGRAVLVDLAGAATTRREVAFHARIRFSAGPEVAGFDSLLVKGSIDLWTRDERGRLLLYDHKTNSPRGPLRDPAALAAHYGPQLRLYALAAERILDEEVHGAALLLLDPAWAERGADVLVPIDVSGSALEETRRLVRAYATALATERFPARWEDLVRG
jgi:hypothetical protein